MSHIVTASQAIQISRELQTSGKTIVLVGGCFDILHAGHVDFLEKAKILGDTLLVLLESDETISRLKGENRPINKQADRARLVAALKTVDYVILLPDMRTDADYDEVITQIKPAIIATTQKDSKRFHKERQAKRMDSKVIDVIPRIVNQSTSRVAKLIVQEEEL